MGPRPPGEQIGAEARAGSLALLRRERASPYGEEHAGWLWERQQPVAELSQLGRRLFAIEPWDD